jgi:hypothetical protein
VQRRRTKGWRLPPNTIIVDRTSRYGNPYRVRRRGNVVEVLEGRPGGGVRLTRTFEGPTAERDARQHAVALFARDVHQLVAPADLERLRGHDVACTCDPDDGMACHGDVLLAVANR